MASLAPQTECNSLRSQSPDSGNAVSATQRGECNAASQNNYFSDYPSLKLTRDENGVLVAEFHANGGPFIMTAQSHTEFVDAFYRIAQDRANKIVILTGAGGELLLMSIGPLSAMSQTGRLEPGSRRRRSGFGKLANIRVPVIGLSRARPLHSDYTYSSVIVAADGATFQDVAHFSAGVAPGDGIFTLGAIALRRDERKRSC